MILFLLNSNLTSAPTWTLFFNNPVPSGGTATNQHGVVYIATLPNKILLMRGHLYVTSGTTASSKCSGLYPGTRSLDISSLNLKWLITEGNIQGLQWWDQGLRLDIKPTWNNANLTVGVVADNPSSCWACSFAGIGEVN